LGGNPGGGGVWGKGDKKRKMGTVSRKNKQRRGVILGERGWSRKKRKDTNHGGGGRGVATGKRGKTN